ncbi:MAG TPA: hypothetical protein VGG00_09770 [Rhodanobacter sp.]|jgi:hypothetical protein
MKTTLYTVLCIAVRLGAVLMAVGILEQVPSLFVTLHNEDSHFMLGVSLLEGAGLLVAFALWLWPNILVRWALGRSRHETLESSISSGQLQHIAFSVMGVWLFIAGLSGCVGRGVMFLMIRHQMALGALPGMAPTNEWHWMAQYATTAAAGAALTFGSRGLVGLLHRLRGYPHNTITQADPDASTAQDG